MTWQQEKAAREELSRQQLREAAKRQADGLTKVQAVQKASEVKENANGTLPLSEQEQRDLVALFQAFLKLKNTDLRLHFYADTGGGLTDMSGATIHDEKLIAHWLDMSEGLATIEAMLEAESEATV